MPLYKRVRRLGDGQVDPACEVAQALAEAIRVAHDPKQCPDTEAAIVALLPVLLEARWFEAFIPLAWPTVDLKDWADFHVEGFSWLAGIEAGEKPPAGLFCWFRGAGKSSWATFVFAIVCLLGLHDFGLWVGARYQAIVDKVSGVGALLAAPRVRAAFPDRTAPYEDAMTGVRGDWRQGRVATATFALDAIGMDQALRGALRLHSRPGLILLDDIETNSDSAYIRARKAEQITKSIIPAGSDDAAMCWVQNRIHDDSLMAQMLDGKLDWFRHRFTSGPWPQIEGLEWELVDTSEGPLFEIVAGEPTWPAGAGLDISTKQLNEEGIGAFLTEKQHLGDLAEGSTFPRELARYAPVAPSGLLVCRAWDLAATEGGGDFTAGALLGWSAAEGALYILGMAHGQWGADRVEDTAADLGEADRDEFGRYKIVIEDQPGAAGKAWKAHWERDVLPGFVVEFRPPEGSKAWRADALSALWRKGRVFLVEGEWNQALVSEFALFGTDLARHDDQVDAVSLGFNWLTGRARRSRGGVASAAGQSIPRPGSRSLPRRGGVG